MKRTYKLLIIFVFFLFINIIVKADTNCSSDELKRLKEIASHVEVMYKDYITEKKVGENVFKNVTFDITVSNLKEDIKVMIIDNLVQDKYKEFISNTNEATLSGFKSGEKITITIMGFVANGCSGKVISTKTIKLPYYNIFNDEEECQKYPDFKYCGIWIEDSVTRETFNNEFNKYINSINKGDTNPIVEKENDWTLLIIIGGIILFLIILVVISMIVARKRRRNSL